MLFTFTSLLFLLCLSPQKELFCEVVHKLNRFMWRFSKLIIWSYWVNDVINNAKRRIALKASLPIQPMINYCSWWSMVGVVFWFIFLSLLNLHLFLLVQYYMNKTSFYFLCNGNNKTFIWPIVIFSCTSFYPCCFYCVWAFY